MKRDIKALLESGEYSNLLKLHRNPVRIVNKLISISYNKETLTAWRAMEAIGVLSKEIAANNPEFLRTLVGKLLWMIRDESGGIGWSVPEILGEIVRNNPVLCRDISRIIVSFHGERMLTPGVLWAIGRMGHLNDEMVSDAIPVVITYLRDNDVKVKGNALYALGEIGSEEHLSMLEALTLPEASLSIYIEGRLQSIPLHTLRDLAVKRLISSLQN